MAAPHSQPVPHVTNKRRQSEAIAQPSGDRREDFANVLNRVSQRVAPVWPLKNYVAVNPYLGMADLEWISADRFLKTYRSSSLYMPIEHYARLWNEGRLTIAHIESAIDEMLRDGVPGAACLTTEWIESTLSSPASRTSLESKPESFVFRTIAQWVDQYSSSDWERTFRDEVGRHCAMHYDQGQATWSNPWSQHTLYESWLKAQPLDRRLELEGLSGFRAFVKTLPSSPADALRLLLEQIQVPALLWESVLLSQAFDVSGWAAWTKYQALEAERRGVVCDDFLGLLAMRLAYDSYLSQHIGMVPDWSSLAESLPPLDGALPEEAEATILQHCLLRASEIAQRQQILGQLTSKHRSLARFTGSSPINARTLAQMVFCIDVRSERIRRAFETSSPRIKTSGFAGFFGIPMELVPWGERQSVPQAPAPVVPQIRVEENYHEPHSAASQESLLQSKATIRLRRKVWKLFQSSASSGLGHVETAGIWYGWQLLRSTLGLPSSAVNGRVDGLHGSKHEHLGPCVESSAGLLHNEAQQTKLALNLVRSLGLHGELGRFVVFCGHAGASRNNPLQAALDCGACCGHSGESNARYAARLLNHPSIRSALAKHGFEIPSDVHFLAAVHNTTTDDLTFFDLAAIPSSHQADFKELERCAKLASRWTRLERQPSLDCHSQPQMLQRAEDWSELRPEWGLAGNVAMVVGPRSMTQSAFLDGRVFLHDYDASNDLDSAILETIMTAPMVVAHWINMQYYASTVDNQHFGCGTKTIHNVTGHFGLLAGGGGDLLTGLPLQSLGNGTHLQHEPLRLQVVIAASREKIHQIVEKTPLLRDLVCNDWLHLVALEEERFFRYTRRMAWLPLHVEPLQASKATKELGSAPTPSMLKSRKRPEPRQLAE